MERITDAGQLGILTPGRRKAILFEGNDAIKCHIAELKLVGH